MDVDPDPPPDHDCHPQARAIAAFIIMGPSIMITEICLVLLLITTPQFSTAVSIFDIRQSGSNGAASKVEKRAANTNPGKAEAGKLAGFLAMVYKHPIFKLN